MIFDFRHDTGSGGDVVTTGLRGTLLLDSALHNKGTAFPDDERRAFDLNGLLPLHVTDLDEQADRAYQEFKFKTTAMEKHIYLRALQDRNEVLFYRLLLTRVDEMMPLIYTPTVGDACRHFSQIYRRRRGLFIAYPRQEEIEDMLDNRPYRDVDVIVVTDGERILGLGDQGCGGMGIPIGKLSLYSLCGGIHPARTLPLLLDVGTDNEEHLRDPHYLGWRSHRVRGQAYLDFIERFIQAVGKKLPRALLQWEDFSRDNASHLLDLYKDRLCTFNDDIQGTAAVAVAGIFAASRAAGRKLTDERLVIAGAGAAGIGIARLFRSALRREGLSDEALRPTVAMLDSKGLVVDAPDEYRRDLAWTGDMATAHGLRAGSSLLDVVKAAKPTVLLGVSGVPGLFGEEVVRAMASQVERPVVFPLSNPTSKSEASPADVMAWTAGRALMATGSPFEPVDVDGRKVRIGQGNNAFVFPGVGLGVLVSEAREVTDGMFAAAADALAAQLPEEDLRAGSLFPRIAGLRGITARVAEAVVRQAVSDGVARNPPENPAETIAAAMWDPAYPAIDVA